MKNNSGTIHIPTSQNATEAGGETQRVAMEMTGEQVILHAEEQEIEPIDLKKQYAKDQLKFQLELEKFMSEKVTVTLNKVNAKGDINYISVSVNGVPRVFVRGQPTQVERKYVEVLAHAVFETYEQEVDPYSPDKRNIVGNRGLSYPFNVNNDTPKGQAWLQRILGEAHVA